MTIRYRWLACAAIVAVLCATFSNSVATAADETPPIKGWKKGKGWGWIWGKEDEVGSLNAMTAESRKAA